MYPSVHEGKWVKSTCMVTERCEHGSEHFLWMVSGLCNSPHKWIAGLQTVCYYSWAHRETGSHRCFWRWRATNWPEFSWGQSRLYQRNSQSKVEKREKMFPSVLRFTFGGEFRVHGIVFKKQETWFQKNRVEDWKFASGWKGKVSRCVAVWPIYFVGEKSFTNEGQLKCFRMRQKLRKYNLLKKWSFAYCVIMEKMLVCWYEPNRENI